MRRSGDLLLRARQPGPTTPPGRAQADRDRGPRGDLGGNRRKNHRHDQGPDPRRDRHERTPVHPVLRRVRSPASCCWPLRHTKSLGVRRTITRDAMAASGRSHAHLRWHLSPGQDQRLRPRADPPFWRARWSSSQRCDPAQALLRPHAVRLGDGPRCGRPGDTAGSGGEIIGHSRPNSDKGHWHFMTPAFSMTILTPPSVGSRWGRGWSPAPAI